MRGSVTERRPGYWQARVHVGLDPVTGKRREVTRAVKGDRAKADKLLRELVGEVDERRPAAGPTTAVARRRARPSTRRRKRRPAPAGPTRLPFAPLEAALVRDTGGCNVALWARRLGVNRGTVYHWEHDGVPVMAADGAAIRLGLHPALIWGDGWWVEEATP